jgi:hypothetical protein
MIVKEKGSQPSRVNCSGQTRNFASVADVIALPLHWQKEWIQTVFDRL